MRKKLTLAATFIVALAAGTATAVDFQTDLRARMAGLVASDNYQRADLSTLSTQMGRLLQATIREHPAELPKLISRDLKALPKCKRADLPELVSSEQSLLDCKHVNEQITKPNPLNKEGAEYYCMLFLPSKAAAHSVQMWLARQQGPAQFGARSVVSQLAPPRLFRLSDDVNEPVIVVDAIDGVYVVELTRLQDGLFFPKKMERRGGGPRTEDGRRTTDDGVRRTEGGGP